MPNGLGFEDEDDELERRRQRLGLAGTPATSTGLDLGDQPDLPREIARGTSMRGSTAAADTGGGLNLNMRTVLGLGLAAVADILTNIEGSRRGTGRRGQALETVIGLQQGRELSELRQQAAGREQERLDLAKKGEARAQRGEERAAALEPLQRRAAEIQLTSGQMGNLKTAIDLFDTLSRRASGGAPEQQQAAVNEALKIHEGLGLTDVIPKDLVRNIMARPDLLESLTRYKPYLDQLPPGVIQILRQTKVDDPKDLKGLFDTLDVLVSRAAEADALTTSSKAIEALKASGKRGPFTARDLQMAFLDKPLAFEKLESDIVAGRLAPDYVSAKTQLEAQKARAVRETPEEAAATTSAVEKARQLAGLDPAITERAAHAAAKTAELVEAAKLRAQAAGPEKPVTPEEVDRLRDDFVKASGDFVKIRDSYNRIVVSAKNPSAAGDLSIVYNYMKMLDPGSVVRESEFAQAASAGSFGARMQGLVQRALNGELLFKSIRNDFTDQAKKLFEAQKSSQDTTAKEFTRLAKLRKIDPARVIIELSEPDTGPTPPTGSLTGAPDPAKHPGRVIEDEKTKQRYRSDGTRWVPF